MTDQVELEIAPREVMGKATKKLRKAGIIPAHIYGHNQEPEAVQVDAVTFERLQKAHKATNIISLKMPNAGAQTVLIRHVQHQPSTGKVLHVDFYRVGLTERLAVKLPLVLVGESPAVKIGGGVLLQLLDTLEVECRASDIVAALEVDVSAITEIDGAIRVSEIRLPADYTLITNPSEPVVKVNAPTVEPVAEPTVEAQEPIAENNTAES